jgi:hypothetical protein
MGAQAVRIVNGPEIVAAPTGVRNLPAVTARAAAVVAVRPTPSVRARSAWPAAGTHTRGRLVDILV